MFHKPRAIQIPSSALLACEPAPARECRGWQQMRAANNDVSNRARTPSRQLLRARTSSQLPFFSMYPVAAVPNTPARTPAVLLMPSSTPEYRGPMSCVSASRT